MKRHILRLIVCISPLIGFLLIGSSLPVERPQGVKTFESHRYGYAVQYPEEWYLDATGDVDAFEIDSFPLSEAVRGVHIPLGGASIYIVVPSQVRIGGRAVSATLDAWIQAETTRMKVTGKRTFSVDDKKPVVEIRSRCCAVPPFQDGVSWYFQVDGHLFRATLLYYQGDPNADKLLQVLKEIVLSLRLTQ